MQDWLQGERWGDHVKHALCIKSVIRQDYRDDIYCPDRSRLELHEAVDIFVYSALRCCCCTSWKKHNISQVGNMFRISTAFLLINVIVCCAYSVSHAFENIVQAGTLVYIVLFCNFGIAVYLFLLCNRSCQVKDRSWYVGKACSSWWQCHIEEQATSSNLDEEWYPVSLVDLGQWFLSVKEFLW